MRTEELLYEKHFPFKLVLSGFKKFKTLSCLLLLKVDLSGTLQLCIRIRKPPKEQQVSY